MGVIQDDTTPFTGPGFDWDKPKGAFGTDMQRQPAPAVDDINTAISSTLKRLDWDLLEEDGTGEYVLAGENKDEES